MDKQAPGTAYVGLVWGEGREVERGRADSIEEDIFVEIGLPCGSEHM